MFNRETLMLDIRNTYIVVNTLYNLLTSSKVKGSKILLERIAFLETVLKDFTEYWGKTRFSGLPCKSSFTNEEFESACRGITGTAVDKICNFRVKESAVDIRMYRRLLRLLIKYYGFQDSAYLIVSQFNRTIEIYRGK